MKSNHEYQFFVAGKLLLNNFCGGKLITATKAPFTGKTQKTICCKGSFK